MRKINDCFYYYNSYCYKGDNCHFRHEPRALGSNRVCKRWKRHMCKTLHCPYRHFNIYFRHSAAPRYREDRCARTPFLKTRYSISEEFGSDYKKWTRRVFFAGDEVRNKWPGIDQFALTFGEWTNSHRYCHGQQEGPYPQRENIKIELKRVQENVSSYERIFSGNYQTNIGIPLHSFLSIKNENIQTTTHALFETKQTDELVIKPETQDFRDSDRICTCSRKSNSLLFKTIRNRGFVKEVLNPKDSGDDERLAQSDSNSSNGNTCHETKQISAVAHSINKTIETSENRFGTEKSRFDNRGEIFSSRDNTLNTNSYSHDNSEQKGEKNNHCMEEISKNIKLNKEEFNFNNASEHLCKPIDLSYSRTIQKSREVDEPSDLGSMMTQIPSTSHSRNSSLTVQDSASQEEILPVGYFTRSRARMLAERNVKSELVWKKKI